MTDKGSLVEQPKVLPTGARVAIALTLCLLGFGFPLLFVPAALILWSVIDDRKTLTKQDSAQPDNRRNLTAADSAWESHWLLECESPAEEAFFSAMVNTYGFTPDQGVLRANGNNLKLQVVVRPYRVDFLMNDRLVIEVDGEAYHSEPEHVKRDAKRDEYLVSRGYTVLRIPAKIVFRHPAEAVRRVKTALATLTTPKPPAPPVSVKKLILNSPNAIRAAVIAMGDAAEELNLRSEERITRARAEAATPKPKWLSDPEFSRQLGERVEARMAKKRSEIKYKPLGDAHYFDSLWKEGVKKEETSQLLKEWDDRAAKAPLSFEFRRRLMERVDILVANDDHSFESNPSYLAFPGMVDSMRSSIRAKHRWEEEGRLIEQWEKASGSQIGA